MTEQDEHKLIALRRQKLNQLREQGAAYPNDFRRDAVAAEISTEYGDKDRDWFEANVTIGPDGTIYAGNTNFNYYAITPDCRLKWTYGTGANAWSAA